MDLPRAASDSESLAVDWSVELKDMSRTLLEPSPVPVGEGEMLSVSAASLLSESLKDNFTMKFKYLKDCT